MQNRFFIIISFFLFLGCTYKPKKNRENSNIPRTENIKCELKIPYLIFSKGYDGLNSEMISSSYTKDAILINVYNDSEPESY